MHTKNTRPYIVRHSQSIHCMILLINGYINGETFVRQLLLHKKLFSFEIQEYNKYYIYTVPCLRLLNCDSLTELDCVFDVW